GQAVEDRHVFEQRVVEHPSPNVGATLHVSSEPAMEVAAIKVVEVEVGSSPHGSVAGRPVQVSQLTEGIPAIKDRQAMHLMVRIAALHLRLATQDEEEAIWLISLPDDRRAGRGTTSLQVLGQRGAVTGCEVLKIGQGVEQRLGSVGQATFFDLPGQL